MTPGSIAHTVPGVWVIHFPTYFNFCPFFLEYSEFQVPLGGPARVLVQEWEFFSGAY